MNYLSKNRDSEQAILHNIGDVHCIEDNISFYGNVISFHDLTLVNSIDGEPYCDYRYTKDHCTYCDDLELINHEKRIHKIEQLEVYKLVEDWIWRPTSIKTKKKTSNRNLAEI